MSEQAAVTFDAIWARTGLEGSTAHPRETLRAPERTGGRETLPHLTIGEDAPEAPGAPQLIVRELLGEGGMGVVHVARQPLLDRDVAIKRVRPGASRGAAAGLLREARYMGSLEHPNIVPVHALGADDAELPVLVMKRIEGTSWRTLIGRPDHETWERWPEEDDPVLRHVEILLDVTKAVAFAHARGVVHRDLKPDNVLVGGHGEVYVLDWGIAARAGQPAPDGLVGTPAYMPPEMARSATVRPAMDVYLLGGCLFEVLSGAPPHPGGSLEEVLEAAFGGVVGPLPEHEPELAAICRRALEPDPEQRWASVAVFQRALDRWRRSRGLRRLLEAARAHLEALRGLVADGAPREVADALAACRFGFGQVLEADADAGEARSGLHEALRLSVAYALDHDRLDDAESWLEALGEAGGEVGPLEARLRSARQAQDAHRALAADFDLAVSARQRGAVLGVVALGGLVITAWLLLVTTDPLDSATPFVIGAGFTVLIGVSVGLAWPWLRRNAVNRGLAGTLVSGMLLVELHRAIAWATETPVWLTLATDLQILAMFGLTAGMLVMRWGLVFGVVCALGSVGCVWFPDQAVAWFGLTTVFGLASAAIIGPRLQ